MDNAVWLCAYLCKESGVDPLDKRVLLCHSEGHAQGIATNHADVMHWFPKEGKTMDDFRKAVKEAMNEKQTTGLGNSGTWSDAGCQWAVDNGLFIGDGAGNYNWTDPMTREAMAVVLYRYHKAVQDGTIKD